MDPRVKASAATLARQFTLSKGLYDDIDRVRSGLDSVRSLRTALRAVRSRATGELVAAIDSLDRAASQVEGGGGGFGGGGGTGAPTLAGTIGQLGQLYDALQEADVTPTTQLVAAVADARRGVPAVLARWNTLRSGAVAGLDARLRAAGLPTVGAR